MSVDTQKVRSIFLAAVEECDCDRWPAYLDEACSGDAELRRQVEILLRAHQQANSLLDAPPLATLDETIMERPGTLIGPYKLLEPIGEGGMGTVWMAQQTEPVKRVVALKLIKAGMDSKQVIARFEAERQALALMDHVNIARVLDAGTTSGGRPYFVMDLVKGVPITKYCDEHHLTPRQRLELFIPICQAIQHAHQKGIIHRDLKPSNVLVALYDGKPVPKVIDFGVAKAAGQSLTDKTLVTGFGNIVGTLEYMSPEQAEVNQLDIDTRSDIYSLGVLLYELLTGSPPFTRKDLEKAGMLEMLRVIREQEPSKPSTKLSSSDALPTLSANRGTEPAKLTKLVRGELDWIVMKALEKDRNRRYETANGFAMDVQRYLADEPVQACPPSAGYRLRKFSRRNKGGLAVTALVLFFLVLLGSGIGWAVRDRSAREAEIAQERANREAELTREREARRAKAAGQVESILEELDRLEKEQKWPEALAAARRAEAVVAGGEADAATAERVRERLRDLEFIDRLEQIRMVSATSVEGKFNYAGADRDYARAFRDYGVDVDALAVEASIDRLKARAALTIPLAVALEDWGVVRDKVSERDAASWKRLVAVARGIDPEPLRDRLRSTWGRPVSETRDELRRLTESIDIRAQPPATVVLLALALQSVRDWDSSLRLLRDAQFAAPGDFWLNFELGSMLNKQKDYEGAIRFHTAAVSIRPYSAAAHINLGIDLAGQKKLDEAIACYRRALALDPKYAKAHYCLGGALRGQKKLDEAIASYRKAIELDPKYAMAHNSLGIALRGQKKLDEAIACYRKAIELDPKYAMAHNSLGNALRDQKKLDEAIAAYRKAIELDPKSSAPHFNLGLALRDRKMVDEAIAAYRKAIELDPKHAGAYEGLGVILCDVRRDYENAAACFRKYIELEPKNAIAHFNLGNALYGQKKWDEAIVSFRKAIELNPQFADAYIYLGNILCAQKKLDEALDAYRKAIELDPNKASYYHKLGYALYEQQKLDEAIACYRRAIELDSTIANFHYNLGLALRAQKKLDEAVTAFRKAIEIDPECASAYIVLARDYHNLGVALRDQKKLDEAIACYHKAIELDPNKARYYHSLGLALRDRKKVDEAIAAYRKAIELDSKFADAYVSLGVILCDVRRDYENAAACFRKAIELDPENAIAFGNLGAALAHQGKLDEAIAAFRKAIQLDPKHDKARQHVGQALGIKGWNLINSPDPKLRDPKRAIEAIKEAVEVAPQSKVAWQYMGWAQYRVGDWRASIEALDKSCKLQDGGTGDAGQWIVSALAHARLAAQQGLPEKEREHHKAEARRRYEEADRQIDSWWRVRPGHRLGQAIWDFRAEARELMAAKDGKK